MSAEHDDPPSQDDLERRRVPLERKISLKFKEFRGFITEYSENLSLGGMFIRTTAPKPAGTIFDFELSLTDDFKLVQGIGEVVWVRPTSDGGERNAGMGVRFLDLSAESRKLIQRIVEEHVRRGGTPFELEAPSFPPPPLRAPPAPPQRPATPAPAQLFHPTAVPMSAPPPVPRAAAPATRPSSPVSPEAPTAHLPRFANAPRPSAAANSPATSPGGSPSGTDEIAAFPLDDAEESVELLEALPEHALGYPEEPRPAWAPQPPPAATAPPLAAASTPPARTPAGFDEVARALATERDQALADALVQEETVRLERSPLGGHPPATAHGSVLVAAGAYSAANAPLPPTQAAVPAYVQPTRRPPETPRRRSSSWPAIAAVLLLLLLGGALAALYLGFPQLLPTWAPGRPEATRSTDAGGPGARSAEVPPAVVPRAPEPIPSIPVDASGQVPAPDAPDSSATPSEAAEPVRRALFTTVEEIFGERNAAGTVVTLVADGNVPRSAVSHFRLDGPNPREVVRLRGVTAGFPRSIVAVKTPEVDQVRTGYHVRPEGNELHVVIDLGAPRVRLVNVVTEDNRVQLLLVRQ